MKRIQIHTLFLMLFLAALSLAATPRAARAEAGHQRALLIGISTYDHYNKSGLFPNLDCDEDLKRIKAALVSTFKFDPDPAHGQITVLNTPAQTTRAAILAAFDKLVTQTNPGDIVYVHYSGHGSQVPDATSPGGLDDTIVPSDFQDDQSNEIKGKEIAAFLQRLKTKGAAQVTLSFDCCHSATVTRGEAKKRGLSWEEYVAWYQAKYGKTPTHPASRGAVDTSGGVMRDLQKPGYVVLSACSNNSCAFETQAEDGTSLGRLSYVLSQVLTRATPQTTYQQVYDQVKAIFKQKFSDQNPQIDGNPNTTLFGGSADPPRPSLLVSVVTPGHYAVDAGKLQGMTQGSSFAIYDKTATDFTPDTQIAEANLTGVGLTSSEITLTKKLKPNMTADDLSAAHAVETTHNYGAFHVTFDAPSVQRELPAQAPAILTGLEKVGIVSTQIPAGNMPDLKVARLPDGQARGAAKLALVRGDTGAPIQTLDETADLPAQFVNAVQRQARYRYATTVLNKQNTDSGVQVKIRLVPAVIGQDPDGNTVWKADAPLDASHTLHIGDYFTIEAQSRSDKDVWLTVLDIGSDYSIAQAWPNSSHIAQDNILKQGQPDKWVKLWNNSDVTSPMVFHATTPDPGESFKAIATDSYVSFRAIVNRDKTRAPPGPFDVLLGPAAGVDTRGIAAEVSPATWATDTFDFKVQDAAGAANGGRGIKAMAK